MSAYEKPRKLYSDSTYCYKLVSMGLEKDLSEKECSFFVQGKIKPSTMDKLIYYFQGKFWYILECIVLEPREVTEILKSFYGFEVIDPSQHESLEYYRIDLYQNWESLTRYHSKIVNDDLFYKEGVDKMLYDIGKKYLSEQGEKRYVFNVNGQGTDFLKLVTYKNEFSVFGLTEDIANKIKAIYPDCSVNVQGHHCNVNFPAEKFPLDKYRFAWTGTDIEIQRYDDLCTVKVGNYIHNRDIQFPLKSPVELQKVFNTLGLEINTFLDVHNLSELL